MKNLERKKISQETVKETEQERRARLISRYIETKVIKMHELADKQTEQNIQRVYEGKTPQEKANELYQKMMVYQGTDKKQVNPKLISRIKVLFNDRNVQMLLPDTYGEARVDQKIFRGSELAKNYKKFEHGIKAKSKEVDRLERELFQEKIKNKDDIDEVKTTIVELREQIEEDSKERDKILLLSGQEKIKENTDVSAILQYEKLVEYRTQLDEGFVWLPSREEIDRKAMKIIDSGNSKQTRKGIFFISEPGSGKTEQIRAIARRLTGMDRVKVACGPRMGDPQLLGKEKVFPAAKKIEEGVYTDFRDTVSAAWTGHDYSYQDKPVRENCQTVELDEFPKAFENENVFTRLKGFFSLKDGDVMPGTDKRVFSGRVMFASGNIGQHHGAKRFPPALEREFEVIPVDYPEMSIKNPELYVFMLLALIEKGHIQASKTELSPGYTKRDMSDDEKEVLSDGSVAIAKDELIEDPADKKHGFLYRLSYAVKAVQDAYMARGGENSYIDYTQRDLLRFKDSEDGSMYVDEGGEMRVLGTTITLNDISGWMIGYNAQLKKKKSLALPEYLQEKLKEKTQSKHEDEEILKAIFNYFGLLDKVMSDKGAKPLTPKEIGYLSPRVPRPVYVEKSETGKDEGKEPSEISAAEAEIYETKQVLLESGTKILMKEGEFSIDKKIVVNIGDKFIVNNESFVFAGTVEDQSSEQNDKLVGQFANGEKLYKIFNVEEVDFGIVENFKNIIGKTGIDDMEKIFINYWEIQGCVKQQGKIVFQK